MNTDTNASRYEVLKSWDYTVPGTHIILAGRELVIERQSFVPCHHCGTKNGEMEVMLVDVNDHRMEDAFTIRVVSTNMVLTIKERG